MAGTDGLTFPDADALAKGLMALGPKLGARVADDGLKQWTKPIIGQAKALVARRTGGLAKSITDRKQKTVTPYLAARIIGFRRPSGSHAHFIEFGNSHQAAQPFVRPAIDAETTTGIEAMGRAIASGIDAQAAKLLKG